MVLKMTKRRKISVEEKSSKENSANSKKSAKGDCNGILTIWRRIAKNVRKRRYPQMGHLRLQRMMKSVKKRTSNSKEERRNKKGKIIVEASKEDKSSSDLYRCNLHPTIHWMEQHKALISTQHVSILKKIPFATWFKMFYKIKLPLRRTRKQVYTITRILDNFVSITERFKIGPHLLNPPPTNLSLIFGLPLEGKCIHPLPPSDAPDMKSQFVMRYFEGRTKSELTKKELEKAMYLSLTKYKDDVMDFPKLWILHCLLIFFFVSGAEIISWRFLTYINDLGKTGEVSWPKSIHSHLMNCVLNSNHRGKCYGRVIFLMCWLCEHT